MEGGILEVYPDSACRSYDNGGPEGVTEISI